MMRFISTFIAGLAFAGAAFAEPATLRSAVEAHGPAITLGDIFENAGAASGRAVALAPGAGRSVNLPVRVVAAAANAAGLEWAPPQGLQQIEVTRSALPALASMSRSAASADASVRRGETVTLTYEAPGVQLITRARALEDGNVGQSIRALNLSSNRQIDVVVTGTGAATVMAMR